MGGGVEGTGSETKKETILRMRRTGLCWLVVWVSAALARSDHLVLPTPNRALFDKGRQNEYFVPTPGKDWISGTFGCVRTEGWQLHEGLDIKCVQRDKKGESADAVSSFAEGVIAYINQKPSLSNYGKYLIIRHQIEGLEVYSTYAHLSEIDPSLRIGSAVKPGTRVATMGRTSNTRQRISRDRAHLHFELNLLLNDQFPAWFQKTFPGERNDHGVWNGRNMVGIDPRAVLLHSHLDGERFSLLRHLREQPELCRVLVRDTSYPWLKRYSVLVSRMNAPVDPLAGYEIVLNFNGLPFQLIPRSVREISKGPKYQLLRVNTDEHRKNPCRKLVRAKGNSWELTDAGVQWLELLTF